jgi:hypothetical protein
MKGTKEYGPSFARICGKLKVTAKLQTQFTWVEADTDHDI